jgi:hypothetical protein
MIFLSIQCGTCDKWLNNDHAAKQHMEAVWERNHCDAKFYWQYGLDYHKKGGIIMVLDTSAANVTNGSGLIMPECKT